jgi:hypothetical protein
MRISGSALPRVVKCPASAALPQAHTTSEAAERGTIIHRFITDVIVLGANAALKNVPKAYQSECDAIDLGWLDREASESEAAFVYDTATDTARYVGNDLGRNYGELKPTEIPMALDILERGAVPTVTDIKTGSRVDPVADNWQIRAQALAVTREQDVRSVIGQIAYLQEDGSWEFDRVEWDVLDLDGFASDLATAVHHATVAAEALTIGLVPDVSAGEHCRYCPAAPACPAHTALVRVLPPTLADIEPRLTSMTPAQLGESWETLRKCESLLKRIREGLEAVARVQPLELPDGTIVREVETVRESIDPVIASRVLGDLRVTPEEHDAAVELSVTKASLKRALNGRTKEALAAIAAAGGIRSKVTTTVRETKP